MSAFPSAGALDHVSGVQRLVHAESAPLPAKTSTSACQRAFCLFIPYLALIYNMFTTGLGFSLKLLIYVLYIYMYLFRKDQVKGVNGGSSGDSFLFL